MPDKNKANLSESVRPGGFFRVEALSGKEEDATYVDANGQPIPREEWDQFKSASQEKSDAATDLARQQGQTTVAGVAPGTPAATGMAGAVPRTQQQPVVDTSQTPDAGVTGVTGDAGIRAPANE
jgi:hypothetical protein